MHNGHQVAIWSPSGRSSPPATPRSVGQIGPLGSVSQIDYYGAVEGSAQVEVLDSLATLKGFDAVLFALPAYGLHSAINQAAATIGNGQTIIFTPTLALAPLYLAQCLQSRQITARIIGFGTTVATARKMSPNKVTLFNVRARLDCAALPASDNDHALRIARQLYGDRFALRRDILATTLSNTNPVFHVPLILGNLARIERGEVWTQYDSLTASIARIAESVDAERCAVARAFDASVRTIHEHFAASFNVPITDLATQSAAVHATIGSPAGPNSLDHRYITEDVPYGLAVTAALGAMAGVATPVTDACITLASTAVGHDLRQANEFADALGFTSMDSATLLARLR